MKSRQISIKFKMVRVDLLLEDIGRWSWRLCRISPAFHIYCPAIIFPNRAEAGRSVIFFKEIVMIYVTTLVDEKELKQMTDNALAGYSRELEDMDTYVSDSDNYYAMGDVINATIQWTVGPFENHRIIPIELAMQVSGYDRYDIIEKMAHAGCRVLTHHGELYVLANQLGRLLPSCE